MTLYPYVLIIVLVAVFEFRHQKTTPRRERALRDTVAQSERLSKQRPQRKELA